MTKSISSNPAPKTSKALKRKGGDHQLDAEDRIGGDGDDSFVAVDSDVEFGHTHDEDELPDEHGDDNSVDATDDPVRMYLMQMGAIPLLNRFEEVSAAQQIERTRRRFRHSMLATDYVLQGAVEFLELVRVRCNHVLGGRTNRSRLSKYRSGLQQPPFPSPHDGPPQ